MVLLRNRKSINSSNRKITKEDAARFKVHTAEVADPVLSAVQEAQPFEQAADAFNDNVYQRTFTTSDENGQKLLSRDVFGNEIVDPDISNPTRSRNERPLDTIRGFQYAIAPDPYYIETLETPYLGFKVRENYYFANEAIYNLDTPEQPIYQAQSETNDGHADKKKKRNFFGLKSKKKAKK
ncbi:hypothetical protein KAFR_0D03690 [Kazachstania africana CBS 2517]|uniref:Uncharacterized protein n=1 Tax=Kazachstania africana (strain ATCC 22294 / BCRC 22015 / CBS 2517 / CECT 1963 / NBRC 1671 / NRRL Y-8276) TaxID=1071382 RepID=H2AUG7_KAZAF|nr:hypothetical protein KAFR_0D03690 [Kazachstania africana CBS 2517]CCF58017.1 hypothetical protein KAFR_0D03690 [Kazachstania africana CBS 2517]